MDWEQSQYLRDCIHQAIAQGMCDGFASNPVVTVSMPPLIDLRDFFAGCALAGYCADPEAFFAESTRDSHAKQAYLQADHMLLAKIGKKPDDETPHA